MRKEAIMNFNKLLSGRYLFTVMTAVVFGWAAYSKVLTKEQISAIIMLIIGFYFHKSDQMKGA